MSPDQFKADPDSDVLIIDTKKEENRFSRFELIRWWDQKLLQNANILVIGAGALGNEIIKNLALTGIGNILLVDFDQIEPSNLSRSILFRESDRGRYKADVAAERAREIFPDINIRSLSVNVVTDFGIGAFFWADVILGGLDNREARLAINQNSLRCGKTWIDGAIEGLSGIARVFGPDGPCYECTMSEVDWKVLNARKSCTLLTREEMMSGKTPTTPTIASLIAAVQCQEAIKLLHGLEVITGRGFFFEGLSFYQDIITYKRKAECFSHERYTPVVELDAEARKLTLGEALKIIRKDLGEFAIMELRHEVLTGFSCSECGVDVEYHSSLGRVSDADAVCPDCGKQRFPIMSHQFDGSEPWPDMTLAKFGIPDFDVFIGSDGERQIYYLLNGDRQRILGPLVSKVQP
ncbi:MAG: molybdopterin biosynthesis protein MoeB [Candidatus Riflebacteria bacterium HGW-Riflebacteria-2]|jgi:adenylyltransferase/sulfurtransferase|nr:MAG: molybdopterin biosynthesis protein MoeB [Candidatus Riflebacteria bacterium HGW-Riflebacteria-2]